jgi:hypothetical protein
MATDVELDRVLGIIAATLNDQGLEELDPGRVQEIASGALGGEQKLTVDDGGGLHDESGTRVGTVRRSPSGEWITERQNEDAARSDVAIPSAESEGKAEKLLGKLKPGS